MKDPNPPLTVLYDGACPLCQREIAHVKRLADGQGNTGLCFQDVSAHTPSDPASAAEQARLLARFHVQRSDGSRLDGAAAFVAMWERLPGWRWLARLARLPGMLTVLEWTYRGFLKVRPRLQTLARRLESNTTRSNTP
ncbi:DUF393 domain-containing protein [Limnobacter humi]|uniref:DUF393 domain-containing protein n=1 Tax=Limnobacter humi TaxID=1778671 RepID=A0ABT1WGW8_9BURK|nr:DUF393 domain-containing protein [Limnobacter humi]MCQ8896777.1 DUF393 domain-containing protein [Limnobacter humi]